MVTAPPYVPWHPILDSTEIEPAVWVLSRNWGPQYARIALVRRGDELGYRAETSSGELIGYFVNLKSACLNASEHDERTPPASR